MTQKYCEKKSTNQKYAEASAEDKQNLINSYGDWRTDWTKYADSPLE